MSVDSRPSTDPNLSDQATKAPSEAVHAVPRVSILIVAYNSAALIEACIGSIAPACTTAAYETLMVDNGDGTTEALVAERFPDVRIVPSRGNIGFAAGNNMLARAANADLLLLLNPDMILQPGSIDALLRGVKDHPDAAAWGGITVDQSGEPDAGNAISMPTLLEFASVAAGRSLAGRRPIEGLYGDAKVPVLMGGFVMFSRSAWEQARGLDERFFLYCEEVDLFYRLAQTGHSFWRISEARGYHAIAHGNNFSPTRLLYRAAGTMEFVRHHWSWGREIIAFILIWLGAMTRFVGAGLLARRRPEWRKMSEGYRRIALSPMDWRYGYDPHRGLMARLPRSPIQQV